MSMPEGETPEGLWKKLVDYTPEEVVMTEGELLAVLALARLGCRVVQLDSERTQVTNAHGTPTDGQKAQAVLEKFQRFIADEIDSI